MAVAFPKHSKLHNMLQPIAICSRFVRTSTLNDHSNSSEDSCSFKNSTLQSSCNWLETGMFLPLITNGIHSDCSIFSIHSAYLSADTPARLVSFLLFNGYQKVNVKFGMGHIQSRLPHTFKTTDANNIYRHCLRSTAGMQHRAQSHCH
jgi:hypothetical protein